MQIKFNRRFEKRFEKAPPRIQAAWQERLRLFIANPYAAILDNHKLKGEWLGFRSINITGDWRAIFHETGDNAVVFDTIGTHSQLYG